MMPLFFEDLQIGDDWYSESRKIASQDVVEFADLTGDHDPLHSQEADSPFGGQVAHGLLGLSIMAGLSSMDPSVRTLALVKISDWDFQHPIYPGDTVTAITEVAALEPYGRRAGRVTWHRRLVNQNGVTVQSGTLVTLVAARNRTPRMTKIQPLPISAVTNTAAR